ncbi:MAG: sodium-dependent bicarbonate transport family permease [Hyphomicrobiales bacterium]|nr:sodium-dependent bicarbonate transport family permease [Hyphomicrobiales bacterium]
MSSLILTNLTSPMVLFFVLGLLAALARSDLSIPDAIAKATALYLMMAIGFKGGVGVAEHGLDSTLLIVLALGAALSFTIPLLANQFLKRFTALPAVDAAAVAAHYGSISIVTFVAATQAVLIQGGTAEGYMVAVAAVMETPAILAALWLVSRTRSKNDNERAGGSNGALIREIALNGSIVMLVGSFFIGLATGEEGLAKISPFITDPFQGVLCFFLLDMGLIAGRGLRQSWRELKPGLIAFGIYMPVLSALIAALVIWPVPLSAGGAALFITLVASASYIAVPAAMRVALPEARPAIYLTMSLGITFPFNLTFGIPLYLAIAEFVS